MLQRGRLEGRSCTRNTGQSLSVLETRLVPKLGVRVEHRGQLLDQLVSPTSLRMDSKVADGAVRYVQHVVLRRRGDSSAVDGHKAQALVGAGERLSVGVAGKQVTSIGFDHRVPGAISFRGSHFQNTVPVGYLSGSYANWKTTLTSHDTGVSASHLVPTNDSCVGSIEERKMTRGWSSTWITK